MNEAALALARGNGEYQNTEHSTSLRTLITPVAVVMLLCLAPLVASMLGVDFSVAGTTPALPYMLMAWSAVLLFVLVGVLAVAHFAIDPDDLLTPLLGLTLLSASLVAGFYTFQLFLRPGDEQYLVASWWASRGLISLIVVVAGVVALGALKQRKKVLDEGRALYLMVKAAILLLLLALVALQLLSSPEIHGLIANAAPHVTLPLLILSCAIVAVICWKNRSLFGASVVAMMLALVAVEFYTRYGFERLFDGAFNVAIALRVLAALAALVGIVSQYIISYRAVDGAKRDLVINQRKLDVALETLTRSNEHLMHANWHDQLTGAANRDYFFKEVERAIARAKRNQRRVGFLYLDLDKFKQVNDAYGHCVGDEVLCCFADRIRSVMRSEDCLARVGGDEFVLMVENVEDMEHVSSVAEKIMDMLRMPVQTAKGELDVAVSIGISCFPDTSDVADLIKHADIAMYEAKGNETSRFQLYTQELSAQHTENLALQRAMPAALEAGELSLVYQPIYNTLTEKPTFMEALVRWSHPEKGFVSPAKFIPVAEKSTFINTLGAWVFERACQQLSFWREHHGFNLSVSINISVRQLYTGNLVATIKRCLLEYRIPAADIVLEITEGQLIGDLQTCQGTIEALKALGVTIALDDYGSGFASITHLRNLPIDYLKIDRDLIRNAPRNPQNRVLTRTTIELAHSLNLPVVAEGVEEQSELDLVREYDCDFVQGYHLAKPMNGDDCTDFLVEVLGEQACASGQAGV